MFVIGRFSGRSVHTAGFHVALGREIALTPIRRIGPLRIGQLIVERTEVGRVG